MEASKKLGEIIRAIREDKLKVTQKTFSEKLNITTVYVSYLEQGKKPPSKELLAHIYSLIGETVPDEISKMTVEVKKNKKMEGFSTPPTDIVYELEAKNIYKLPKLKKLLKEKPGDLIIIYGLLRLLIDEGKKKEAKKHLLKYLMKVDKLEDKKWLEASYYELEGNLSLAIRFLLESISEFEKNLCEPDEKSIKIKARLIFQLATIYFKYAQQLFWKDDNEGAIENFQHSLKWHNEIRLIYNDPFYQMDYAGIFLWLALLGIEPQKNWENYIIQAKEALYLNHYKGINNFSFSEWKGLYSKQYVISTISYLGRAFAQLALFETDSVKQISLLKEGEFLLLQHTPLNLSSRFKEYYRFYFNEACFYSIKAEIFELIKKPFNDDLDRCYVNLQEAKYADSNNNLNLFSKEFSTSGGLQFFRKKRTKELAGLIK